jgi:hypothetical protein
MPSNSTPDTVSSDYEAMQAFWTMVSDILEGAAAMRKLPTGGTNAYLPQFPAETDADYAYRVTNAKFTNIYRDIVESLTAKPLAKEVALVEDAPDEFKVLSEDIDGAGNHLHNFAGQVFFHGLNNAVDWIMVDYVRMRPGSTLADERRMNARPYWVHVPAPRVLAVYSDRIGAKEELVHMRVAETATGREGYDEVVTNRVRVYDREPIRDETTGELQGYGPATFAVYEQKTSNVRGSQTSTWELIDEGPISIGIIPMVPFIAGRRKGGSWQFIPPLQDAAYLQIEHFQQESGLKAISEATAFPMLAGNGVTPPMGSDGKPAMVPVGPKAVLYAPPNGEGDHGEWAFIEPNAASMNFLAEQVKATEQQLRELGRQPLTAQTGNLTVVTTAFAAQKGNSLIQAWALNLKDALENAMKITAMWLGQADGPAVVVDTDFDIGLSDDKDPETLWKMREAKDLSHETLCEEYQRRGILSAEFDFEEEMKRLEEELPGEVEQAELMAATLPPVVAPVGAGDEPDGLEQAAA